ncbi:MAG: DUF115 domain-containing protein [Proteobacteria bacterium]|nr:DUF115 domain-containing protein [Pseudomonadota bacterium]MBU4296703.1 DUF115 domain-containing protein [Pseudomonadota bacterium]MCG2748496.1 DUF115 domain-containing protein [Desulfobulbaceae bacterium]
MKNYWQANMDLLKQYEPELHERLTDIHFESVGDFFQTPTGDVSLRYHGANNQLFAYGNDPWQDCACHLQTVEKGATGLVVFVGMGLGYGPLTLLRERQEVGRIIILEPSTDLFFAAMSVLDLRPLIISKQVLFQVGAVDFEKFELDAYRLASIDDSHVLRHAPSFQWRPDLYATLNEQAYMILNKINASGGTTRRWGPTFFKNRLTYLKRLRFLNEIDLLHGAFKGMPAMLVAAGPSLTQSLEELKKVKNHCVIIAADSALAPLLEAGVIPDFVTSIDFLDLNIEKLAPYLSGEWDFSLVSMVKMAPIVNQTFPARHIFAAFPEDRSHDWVIQALGVKRYVATASSVAHLSLGLALILEAEPVFLVGQDLSFTSEVEDHAKGTIIMKTGTEPEHEIFYVKSINGGKVKTDRQLMSLQSIFEDIFAKAPGQFINVSAAGAHIQGTRVMPLAAARQEFMGDELPVAVSDVVDRCVAKSIPFPVENFCRTCEKNITLAKKLTGKLNSSLTMSQELVARLKVIGKEGHAINAMGDLPDSLVRKLHKIDTVNCEVDKEQEFWQQVLELTYNSLSENDVRNARNTKLKEQGPYLRWLSAELDRIDLVNRERLQALMTYQAEVGALVGFLKQEKVLLARYEKKKSLQATLDLARFYTDNHAYQQAKAIVRSSPAEFHGQSAELNVLTGNTWAALLDYEQAGQFWQQAVTIAEASQQAISQFCREQITLWLGFVERYGNAGEKGDNFPHLLPVWLGRIFQLVEQDGNLPAEVRVMWENHFGRIRTWLDEGDVDAARITFTGWRLFRNWIAEIDFCRALLLSGEGESEAARQCMEELNARKPGNGEWLAFQARLTLEQGNFDQGISLLQKAVALDPLQAKLWGELGDVLVADGDLESAVLAYERCFLALPHYLVALNKIGDCYLLAKQPQPAMAAYDAVLEKDPADTWARDGKRKADKMGQKNSGRKD